MGAGATLRDLGALREQPSEETWWRVMNAYKRGMGLYCPHRPLKTSPTKATQSRSHLPTTGPTLFCRCALLHLDEVKRTGMCRFVTFFSLCLASSMAKSHSRRSTLTTSGNPLSTDDQK